MWQPVYGRVTDNLGGCGHSLCLRGRVTNVNAWLNSTIGNVGNFNIRFIDGEERVGRKPDLRTISKEKRKEAIEQWEKDCHDETRVIVDVDIEPNERFIIRINGIEIPVKRLKQIEDIKNQQFEIKLEALTKMRDEGKVGQMLAMAQTMMR